MLYDSLELNHLTILLLRYYVGRKYMFDNNLKEAEEYLRYSFEHCHRDSLDNKKLILIYLIPGNTVP